MKDIVHIHFGLVVSLLPVWSCPGEATADLFVKTGAAASWAAVCTRESRAAMREQRSIQTDFEIPVDPLDIAKVCVFAWSTFGRKRAPR